MLGITWDDLAGLELKTKVLDEISKKTTENQVEVRGEIDTLNSQLETIDVERNKLTEKLDAPQQNYEEYKRQLAEWTEKLTLLTGTETEPETKVGLETRIAQIKDLPAKLKELETQRLNLSSDIFDTLDAQRNAREILFKPVQDLIQKNSLIREDYKLQFQAVLAASADAISNSLFSLIKQTSGEFRGQDEAHSTIRKLYDTHNLNSKESTREFLKALHETVVQSAKPNNSNSVGIFSVLKKDQSAVSVYDLIFGLNFLEPRYSLLFQDAHIEQLSPGQRGALLLIFYLLVDRGRMPIILDQPEENLDNETVYRLLVPVIAEAKKQRQIIMVTHNPNLAVVCDAEQIIYAEFDRGAESTISYKSGAIESTDLNSRVVTILEGTKPAFDNRSGKYH